MACHLRMARIRERWRRIAADHVWPDKPRWAHGWPDAVFHLTATQPYFNLWAIRFDPERGTPIGAPFALTHFDSQSLVISPECGHIGYGCLVWSCCADDEDRDRQHLDARQRGQVMALQAGARLGPYEVLFLLGAHISAFSETSAESTEP